MSRARAHRNRTGAVVKQVVLEDFREHPQCKACYRYCDRVAGHYCTVAGRLPGRRSSDRLYRLAQLLLRDACRERGLPDWCHTPTV